MGTYRLMRVNLSERRVSQEEIDREAILKFGGGRGLGACYLFNEVAPGTDPLGADNKVIFAIGPLAGTGALAASRWMVITKSPLTNTYFRSVGGADFGARMRLAGFDLVIVEGAAAEPVYLSVHDGRGEILGAGDLWGKDTRACEAILRERHGKGASVACIGPAAEKGVRYGVVMSGGRCAGRGGTGTVLASKNLKAIVIEAEGKAAVANPEEFRQLVQEQTELTKTAPPYSRFSEAGTTTLQDALNVTGMFPTRNFREGSLDGWERVSGSAYAALKVKNTTCYGCIVHCGNIFEAKDDPYAGVSSEGPDYETINMFTGGTACTDIGATVMADRICDDFGLDTISAGGAIAFAFELFEKGILTERDTNGLRLEYGNAEAMIELLRMIAERRGLGYVLGEGVRRAVAEIGKESARYAMHIKGLEMPAYEPRAAKWHGLSMVTSNIGGSHCIGYAYQEVLNVPVPRAVDRFSENGNADVVKFNQDSTAMYETGILCVFSPMLGMMRPPLFARLMAAATGIQEFSDPGCLMVMGERIYTLERLFNVRDGLSRQDDAYPERFTAEPLLKAGPAEGQVIRNIDGMLDEYYQVRGWDQRGVPTRGKLAELGLELENGRLCFG